MCNGDLLMEGRITIVVESTGLLHIEGLEKNGSVEIKAGATIEDLLNQLKVQRDHQKFVTAFINGEERNRFTTLHDHDKVTLLLPIGGG
jgi:sulfur carrier protein ThiS